MTAPMSLEQQLGLWKFWSEFLAGLHKTELVPLGKDQYAHGQRTPIYFAGEVAGWVTLPKSSATASADEAKLLMWARVHAPEKIETDYEVAVDQELIDYLKEHRPQSLRPSERLDPQWVDDLTALAEQGEGWTGKDGKTHPRIPGVSVHVSDPSPRVTLEAGAGALIGKAWQRGEIDLPSMLALPAGGDPE